MSERQNTLAGYSFGIGVYILWGLVPLYFKLLDHVGTVETVAHRIVWSVGLLLILPFALGKLGSLRATYRNRRTLLALTISAALIAVNWLVYIWAVTNEHMLAASLGYFLNPLLNVVLGTVFLREKLRSATIIAIGLAASGVAILAWSALDTLWISATLAVSFALYGYVRKITDAGAIEGLAVETALLSPLCAAYLIWFGMAGGLMFGTDIETDMLLIFAALVTSVPLMLFAAAAKRLTLTTLGFVQYIAPSMVFVIGAFVFDEPLNTGQIACFLFIWTGLALFTIDNVRMARANRIRKRATV